MKQYYIFKDGIQVGPYSVDQLKKMLSMQRITEDTIVKPAASVQEAQCMKLKEITDVLTLPQNTVAKLLSISEQDMRIACPCCDQHYKVPASMFSLKFLECTNCGSTFTLPSSSPAEAATHSAEASCMDFNREIPDGDLLCPHCWKSFDMDYVLYISVHSDLYGDPVLGDYVPKRFVPTTFNRMGQPLDEKGLPATEMACPRCHLRIPSGLLDTPSLYFSIAGATSSGKSYFLTCLTHQLRKTLPEYFRTAFFDADPRLNETLNFYEKQLFMSLNPHDITSLPATQIAGEGISDRVRLDDIEVELPKPFVFEFRPEGGEDCLNMVFYDNSGEMFIPGRDEWSNQATFHLAHSNGIVFLFDPSNDAAMRLNICDTRDPQVSQKPRVVDQTILLNEMISRIRRHANLVSSDTCQIPLVIAVGKYDIWRENFSTDLTKVPYITKQKNGPDSEEYVLATDNILQVSYELREMMMQTVPGLVGAAESFFEEVYFIPFSNFGTFAEQKSDGAIGITPSKINPVWVDVPLLMLLSRNQQLAAKKAASSDSGFLGAVVRNKIEFTHPVNGKIIRLPLCYAGAEIDIDGRKYTLPVNESAGL